MPSTPPSAGPNTKPSPKAALTMPKASARFFGSVTSAIYAIAVGMLAEVIPDTTRPTNSHPSVGASAITM